MPYVTYVTSMRSDTIVDAVDTPISFRPDKQENSSPSFRGPEKTLSFLNLSKSVVDVSSKLSTSKKN